MSSAFRFPIRVYWEDTDAGGIVFYANYLKFFERARTEWLRSLGLGQHALQAGQGPHEPGGMFVVAQASLKYLHPARLDDELIATAALQEAGRAGLVIAQQVWLQAPTPQLLCEGAVRVGWVNAQTLRPARIPQALLEKLRP